MLLYVLKSYTSHILVDGCDEWYKKDRGGWGGGHFIRCCVLNIYVEA